MTFTTTLSKEVLELAEQIEGKIAPHHKFVEKIAFLNQQKVIQAFKSHGVSDHHFSSIIRLWL